MCGVSGVCRKAAPCGRLTRRADSAWPICAICPSGQIGSDLISELGLNEKRARERHCERSEAIHFSVQRKNGMLRRFASRNDVDYHRD
jgi:hypothetical protein